MKAWWGMVAIAIFTLWFAGLIVSGMFGWSAEVVALICTLWTGACAAAAVPLALHSWRHT